MRLLSGRRGKKFFWAGLVLWLAFLVEHLDVLQGHEIVSLDYLSRLHQPRNLADSHMAFVSIDSDDFEKLFKGKSPLDPALVITIVREIASAEPSVIVVDLDTTDPDYHLPKNQLHTEVAIVWAREARLPGEKAGSHAAFKSNDAVNPGVVLGGAENPEGPFQTGISNLFVDGDSVRRYKWAFPTRDGGYARSLSLATLDILCSKAGKNLRSPYCQLIEKPGFPQDYLNPAFIEFSMGPPYRTFNIRDLCALSGCGSAAAKAISTDAWKSYLKDKIVFLGGEFHQDYDRYKTAAGDQYGVRIHAEALASEIVGKTIWVKSRVQIVLAEFAALCLLFLAQHWIRNPAVRFWCVLVGTLVFSVILSWISFNTTVAFLNFVPLLGGIFLDVIKDLGEKGLPDTSPKAVRAAAV